MQPAVQADEAYDLVIRGATILDGSGAKAVVADVAITGGKFVKIGVVKGAGRSEINAAGKYLTPGWIDMMDQSGKVIGKEGRAENKLLMGVTTAFSGEGGTPVPVTELPAYFKMLEKQGISMNWGTYYSAYQARAAVVGTSDVKAQDAQIEEMQKLVSEAMEAGVLGLSSATFYPPSSFLTTKELVEMGKAIAPYGGIYAAHMRDESAKLLPAIEEMITIGEEAKIPVEIFHLKNAYAPNWHTGSVNAIELINQARARGVDIAANQYPYVAGGSGIDATVPTWVFADGMQKALVNLQDKSLWPRMKKEVLDPSSDRMVINSGGWENIILVNAQNPLYEKYHNKNFVDVGKAMGVDPAEAAWTIMVEAFPKRAFALYFLMHEEDVQRFMTQPWVSIGSDAGAVEELGAVDGLGLPHPRSYGTFPRIIARYVKETGTLKLEEAIRKMTSLPAGRMKLDKRGLVKEGYWADAVVFNLETIKDEATWEEPLKTPTGIDYVLVNGVTVVEQGKHTGAKPGKVLYGPGYKPTENTAIAAQ
ncbi:MAG: D-aminoacylase [Kordiimonadaceae bacterium]|nr:D-aminoacylase [Kordiimonadaceae bacterium]